MIKAKTVNPLNGKTYFIIGITDVEVARLRNGQPAGLMMEAFGFDPGTGPDTIIVMYGESHDALRKEIAGIEPHELGLIFPSTTGKPTN